ncbi:hypothetical protein [Ancylobacter defluvii]|uniref:Uncharacterized protein n=1 Tax=Ancylobacter defluvii TaxID=1282440 RepID=A0A9W6NAU0_9HYPH|nr:hypothetical protein [Ancylobacter defluvii]MBS7588657.1 hypothetical protein [Ancylobacter defluvii]GLK83937.1 hypothetical protein GCM10017653_20070 [Ancylobacter defluvii]
MLFSIDEDTGTRIVGWIMPDNPSHTPCVSVFEGSEKLAEVQARIVRPLLREQGLHDTGLCGFVVDEAAVSGLARRHQIDVFDVHTQTLVYRRRYGTPTIQRKLFRLETQILPNVRVNRLFDSLFQMSYPRIESLPPDTTRSIIDINFSNSIYLSGRVYLAEYEVFLQKNGFDSCTYVRDPMEELAEQLLTLEWISRNSDDTVKQLGNIGLMSLVDAVKGKELKDADDFGAWLLHLPAEDRQLLSNPLTRLLTCRSADEPLSVIAVPSALDALSGMKAVQLRSNLEHFLQLVGAQLEHDLGTWELPAPSPGVTKLADGLRDKEMARELLTADLELFREVSVAVDRTTQAMRDRDSQIEPPPAQAAIAQG